MECKILLSGIGKYPHIAPKVNDLSTQIVMFPGGEVIFKLGDLCSLSNEQQSAILGLAKLCQFYKRPKAKNAFSCLQNIFET